jgi:hypothetical protein
MGLTKTFTRKNYGSLYKWSVLTGYQGGKKESIASDTTCTGYVYDTVVVNGQIQRLLYVECGYVQ